MSGPIPELPLDVILIVVVFQHLSLLEERKALAHCSQVCRLWYDDAHRWRRWGREGRRVASQAWSKNVPSSMIKRTILDGSIESATDWRCHSYQYFSPQRALTTAGVTIDCEARALPADFGAKFSVHRLARVVGNDLRVSTRRNVSPESTQRTSTSGACRTKIRRQSMRACR